MKEEEYMEKNNITARSRKEAIKILERLRIPLDYDPNKSRGPIFYTNKSGEKSPIYIHVKTKQSWSHLKGLQDQDSFLVLVDCAASVNPPAFYILDKIDWLRVVIKRIDEIHETRPNKKIRINDTNTTVFVDEICRNGKPFEGIDLNADDVLSYKNSWKIIVDMALVQ